MPNWLREILLAIFANGLWETLLALGVGGVIATLKAKREKWAGPVIYGLVAFALVFVIGFTLTGRAPLSNIQAQITPENVEENMKSWGYSSGIDLEWTDIPDSYFGYSASLHGSDQVQIFRVKAKPEYLQFRGTIKFAPQHQAVLSKLSKADAARVLQELALEVARLNEDTAFSIISEGGQTGVVLTKGVLISDLNRTVFTSSFDEIIRNMALVRVATQVELHQAQ